MTHRRIRPAAALALIALLLTVGAAACGSTTTSSGSTPANGALTSDETKYLTDLTAAETQTGQALQSLASLGGLPLSKADKAKLTAADAQLKATSDAWSARPLPSQRLKTVHTLWVQALTGYANGVHEIALMAQKGTKDPAALKSALKQIAKGQTAMKAMLKELDTVFPSASPTATP